MRGLSVLSLVYTPDHVFIAGTGHLRSLYRSTNFGQSWQFKDDKVDGTLSRLFTTPRGSVLAGMFRSGIYRSTDQGQTWRLANVGLGEGPIRAFGTTSDKSLYAVQESRIYRSTDDGLVWNEVGEVIPENRLTPNTFVITPTDDFYAGIQSKGLYHSEDRGGLPRRSRSSEW